MNLHGYETAAMFHFITYRSLISIHHASLAELARFLDCCAALFITYISFHGAGVGELGYMTVAPPLFRTDNFQLQPLCRVWRLTDVEALDRFRLWGQKREYSLIKIKRHLTQHNTITLSPSQKGTRTVSWCQVYSLMHLAGVRFSFLLYFCHFCNGIP